MAAKSDPMAPMKMMTPDVISGSFWSGYVRTERKKIVARVAKIMPRKWRMARRRAVIEFSGWIVSVALMNGW